MTATFLIALTWAIWIASMMGVGTVVLKALRLEVASREFLIASLWTGLLTMALAATLLNFAVPLGSVLAQSVMALLVCVGLGALLVHLARHWGDLARSCGGILRWRRTPTLLYVALVILGMWIVANFATAEPMDYDTGLYRLGLINYARDFSLVPGLANLHDRFGFNSVLYPLSAGLEIGPWEGQGFRLVAGLLVAALATDLLVRVLVPRRQGSTPGDWFLVISTAFLMAIIVTDSGRWIPSPAQDLAALVPALGSLALLLDLGATSPTRGRRIRLLTTVAIATGALSGAIRPLGWVLTVGVTVAAILLTWRRSRDSEGRRRFDYGGVGIGVGLAALILAVMAARDIITTGWVLYPAAILPIDVDWRVPDPRGTGAAITAWARASGDPSRIADVAAGEWLQVWLGSFLRSREVFLLLLMAGGGLLLTPLWPRGRQAWARFWRPIAITLIPAVLYLAAWFITAPDPRFGWAGLVGIVAIPLAWVFFAGSYPGAWLRWAGIMVLMMMLGTQILNDRVFPRGAPPPPRN